MDESLTLKLDALRQRVSTGKAAQWADLQARYPLHAEFLSAITQHFGKPAMVRVKDAHGVIVDTARYAR